MNKKICFYIIIIPLMFFFTCSYTNKINTRPIFQHTEKNVQFELKSDSIWQIPSLGEQTNLHLSLEITNLEDHSLKFPIMDKIMISLKRKNSDELKMKGGQDILLPRKTETITVQPGNKYIVPYFAELIWANNQLQLRLKDDFGSIWWIGPLQSGSYFLYMVYANKPVNNIDEFLWKGEVTIKNISVHIKE